MEPDLNTELENLRAITMKQASQLKELAGQLAICMRSNKELLEANAQLSAALLAEKGKKKP
jgi:hypothetical protein